MHATDFGRTLIIANPAAQSGAAREVAERLQRFLDMTARSSQFDLVLTERMGHAKELAAQATDYRTVIALGGDGVIHEVVNGLMTQDEAVRPALAVLPVGSGNDFAQTLGIDDFSGKDFGALLTCELQRQDIGRIRSWNPASGCGEAIVEYYDQTLSVGIDAAIGLGTTELRKKTGLTGAPLYTLSGLEQFGLRYRNYPMTVSFDEAPAERVRAIIMAIQLGPTYGSGYRICPDADPCDGTLD
ncbi:MAG: diacylglycerol kinase family protein, partial [Collinsella sp.]|nr:diacylglycerol kinase family protein [Collinsella sp.]